MKWKTLIKCKNSESVIKMVGYGGFALLNSDVGLLSLPLGNRDHGQSQKTQKGDFFQDC